MEVYDNFAIWYWFLDPQLDQLVNNLRCIKTYELNALHTESAKEREGMDYLLNVIIDGQNTTGRLLPSVILLEKGLQVPY